MVFEEQKEALQGLWDQSGRDQLQWFVEDDVAIMVWKGSRRARSFKLTAGKEGELVWGSGKFILDPAFKSGSKAVWLSGQDKSLAFTWEFVGAEGPSKEGAPEPRVRRKGKGGKGKGKGRGLGKGKGKGKGEVGKSGKGGKAAAGGKKGKGLSGKGGKSKGKGSKGGQVFQRHIDKADGVPRTYEEMLLRYAYSYSRLDILAYFMDCVEESAGQGKGKGGKGGKGKGKTGKMSGKSGGKTSKGTTKGLVPSPGKGPSSTALEDRRVDPADGRSYTWEQLRAFYAPTYNKKQTEAYWDALRPTGWTQGKGKAALAMLAKGKGKAMG